MEAVRCDIRTYYAVLATITYDSGDVVYVSALTKLASISDVVNLVESVSLSCERPSCNAAALRFNAQRPYRTMK